jgi:hypothetical protein
LVVKVYGWPTIRGEPAGVQVIDVVEGCREPAETWTAPLPGAPGVPSVQAAANPNRTERKVQDKNKYFLFIQFYHWNHAWFRQNCQ